MQLTALMHDAWLGLAPHMKKDGTACGVVYNAPWENEMDLLAL